jgi:hypothetical protein
MARANRSTEREGGSTPSIRNATLQHFFQGHGRQAKMGAVGVRGIPRHGRRHRHRPAKSKPKSPFWFRSRGPLVAAPPHCGLDAAVTSLPHCCARATPGHRLLAAPRPARGAPRPSPRGRAPAPGAAPPAAPWRAHRPRPARPWWGVGTPGSRGSGNRERTANLGAFAPPWAGGGPAHPSPPPVRSPPLNPVSPAFTGSYRLATGAGWRTATQGLVRFLTA